MNGGLRVSSREEVCHVLNVARPIRSPSRQKSPNRPPRPTRPIRPIQ